jgi:hypothetical protein
MRSSTISLLITIILFSHSLSGENEFMSKNVYDNLIHPVFVAKCQECHGENKSKGRLKLNSKEDFLKGGSGAGEDIVIKGNIEDSELIYRITLPKDDEEAMPPMDDVDHYNPVTKEELDVMKAWISLGASFDLLVSDLDTETSNSALHIVNNMPKKLISKNEALQTKLPIVPRAKPELLEKIREKGILVIPIAQNTNAIYVNASYIGKKFDDEDLQLLEPIAEQLIWLNLAKTNVSDKGISLLRKFKLISRLHLENTPITDDSAEAISTLSNLKYLNLYGTKISDASIKHFKNLINLDKIFLWKTQMTPLGAKTLKKHFVDEKTYDNLLSQKNTIQKSITDYIKTQQVKIKELEVVKNQVSSKSQDKVIINTKCPVSQKNTNNSFHTIYEGRKIGFCCSKCKIKFENDGAVFRSKIINFSASTEFDSARKNCMDEQLKMDEKIDELQKNLKVITSQISKMGPDVNLGWEKPIAHK